MRIIRNEMLSGPAVMATKPHKRAAFNARVKVFPTTFTPISGQAHAAYRAYPPIVGKYTAPAARQKLSRQAQAHAICSPAVCRAK